MQGGAAIILLDSLRMRSIDYLNTIKKSEIRGTPVPAPNQRTDIDFRAGAAVLV